jgi:hypothetical protein
MPHSPEQGQRPNKSDEELQQQESTSAQESSVGELPPYVDPAEPILRRHGIPDSITENV